MVTDGSVEILLVEANPDDLELTLTTFEGLVRGLGTYWLLLRRPAAIGAA